MKHFLLFDVIADERDIGKSSDSGMTSISSDYVFASYLICLSTDFFQICGDFVVARLIVNRNPVNLTLEDTFPSDLSSASRNTFSEYFCRMFKL